MQTSKINPGLLRHRRKVLHHHGVVLQPPEVAHLLLKVYASRVLLLAPLRARPRVPIRPLRPSRQTQPAQRRVTVNRLIKKRPTRHISPPSVHLIRRDPMTCHLRRAGVTKGLVIHPTHFPVLSTRPTASARVLLLRCRSCRITRWAPSPRDGQCFLRRW
jgi:hypothetical protein